MSLKRRQFTKEFKLQVIRELEAGKSVAQAESFMKTLKYEEVYLREYETMAEARASTSHFLEAIYNQKRLHSALGYIPQAEFEQRNIQPVSP